MYFINFEKCSICKQKKSVASCKNNRKKVCHDCDPERYEKVALKQKEYWFSRENK